MTSSSDEIIEQIRKYGKSEALRPRGGHWNQLADEKLIKEREYDLANVCKKCYTVKSKNGECMC